MSHNFIFVMVEGGGSVAPQLGIARRLAARGHRVRVLGDPAIEVEARSTGLEFAAFRHAPHLNFRSRARDSVRDWAHKTQVARLARVTSQVMFAPALSYARDVVEALQAFPADVVAIDYMVPGALIGAERAGLPAALLVHTPYPFPALGVPPFGLGLMPARSRLGQLRDALLKRVLARRFEALGLDRFNAARRSLGLGELDSVYDQIYKADSILVLTTKRFDFASAAPLPSHVLFVGPGLEDPDWVAPWQPPWRESPPHPLVVVSLGSTFQNQRQLTQRVADALARLPVHGLVTLGDVFDPTELRLPARVTAVGSAPHRQVLSYASCVITHGGHGTVMKALAHGTPVLCIPLGRDQGDNAARVVASGSGLRLGPGASCTALRDAIARLLSEPAFSQAARKMADAIAEDVARDSAVSELETLASRKLACG